MTKEALIIGGGIAGAVAAIALHDAGWRPTIYEANAADADERGAFLTVAVNGLNALRALGLDPGKVLEAGFATPTLHLGNGAGRRVEHREEEFTVLAFERVVGRGHRLRREILRRLCRRHDRSRAV